MNFRSFILLAFLVFFIPKVFSIEPSQNALVKEIDLLLKQADELKFESNNDGLLKVKQAEKLALKLTSDEKLGEVYTMYGIYYYTRGTYDASLQMYLKAITIHEKYNNEKLIARSLNGVGLIQSVFNQINESIVTFNKCLKIDLKNKNYDGVARSYFNISIGYIELEDYDLATKNLKKSLAYSKMNNSNQTNHMVQNRLGDMMLVKNKIDSAFYYYNAVIHDQNQKTNNWENSYAYTGLSDVFLHIGDYENAEKNSLIAYKYAKKINANWDLERITKILSKTYEKKGNINKAYQYLILNNKYQDSLYSEKKLNEVNYLQLKSKEVENLKLINKNEANIEKSKRDQIIIYSFLILILLLLGILFLIYRNACIKEAFNKELNLKNQNIENQKLLISQQNAQLVSLNESKNKLFSVISHDLRSPISSLIQVLELQNDQFLSPELQQELFEQLRVQTQATYTMLNDLLIWANTQLDGQNFTLETFDLNEIIKNILDFFVIELKKKNIVCTFHAIENQQNLIKADAGQVRIIIQNILSNAFKFTAENGIIDIKSSEKDNFINIHIINSGKEISQERIDEILNSSERLNSELGTSQEEGTGLGLLLVKQFLANHNGMLDIKRNSQNKTEFIISFLKN